MNIEFIFIKDDDREWKLFGIDTDERKEHLPNRGILSMFLKDKIVDQILEMIQKEDSSEHKTVFARVPYPIVDNSNMMIAYCPFTLDELYDDILNELN